MWRSPGDPAEHERSESGTSLVELMIATVTAVALLSTILIGVTRVSTQRQVDLETNLALVAAMNKLEELRASDFVVLPASHGSDFDVLDALGGSDGLRPQAGDPDGETGLVTISDVLDAGGVVVPGLRRATVTVDWVGVSGDRTISLTTLVADRG